jgi:hypothetical protein
MRRSLGDLLFTFAVISDSHVNEAEGRSASPFASNRLANGRFRHVVRSLNQRAPAFTVHLGDMGNPLPELATYEAAAAKFKAIAGDLESPLHLVPGNHCVGDKPGGWVPVPRVCEASLAQYERIYGRAHYAFDHGPCHFALLNSLLINSDLEGEREQRRWLEADLDRAARKGQRPFVMMHYPAYVAAPDELGSYDNLDEPGRSWLLRVCERFGVEVAYSGHVHNYFYNRVATTHLYTLPATSFVRQDYSELFHVEPADAEGGRNDTAKLGYLLVRIYERGHVHELVRTHGRVVEASEIGESDEAGDSRADGSVAPFRRLVSSPLGTEMRENWLSRTALSLNNSVSPFTRRCARNDWGVLALEQMGLFKVRLALQELVKTDVCERMAPLKDAGFEFTVYSHGIPGDAEYGAIRQHRALLAAWELMLTKDEIESVTARVLRGSEELATHPELRHFLNEVRDVTVAEVDDANVKHVANYGFQLTDRKRVEELSVQDGVRQAFGGLVFRLRRRGEVDLELWPAIRQISELGRASGLRHQIHILFAGNLTAERFEDDLASANRAAEAALAAVLAGNVDLTFDTFEDIDRGYFVRNGLVDRRYNPRLAARVLRHLGSALAEIGGAGAAGADGGDLETSSVSEIPDGRLVRVVVGKASLWLVLPNPGCVVRELERPDDSVRDVEDRLTVVDLGSGEVSGVEVEVADASFRLTEPMTAEGPLLVSGR